MIEFQNVSAYRGSTLALKQVTFSVSPGQNTVFLGPNGAGKSTLLKLLSREIYPVKSADSRLRIFGQADWNVWSLRSMLGIVSFDLQHQYRGSVAGRDVIASGLYSSIGHVDHAKITASQSQTIDGVVQKLNLDDLVRRPFSKMSTGEQRRCLLGRALVNKPKLLILDEPTTGLDLPSKFDYLQTIENLMADGVTVMLVTHHIDEISPSITNVILLRDGKITAQGKKSAILTDSLLSDLFGVAVRVDQVNRFFHVTPAG